MKWTEICDLVFPCGTIVVSDPLFGSNKSRIHEIFDVYEGRWNGYLSYENPATGGNWYFTIKSEEYYGLREFSQTQYHLTQKVYSGYLGIFDLKHYHVSSFFRNTGTVIAKGEYEMRSIVPKLCAALLSKYMFLNAELSVVVIE